MITFPNGNPARLVTASPEASARGLLEELGFGQPKSLIMLTGGADELDDALKAQLDPLFVSIARAAAELGALIIDGGTSAGIMQMMGRSMAEQKRKTPLLGVAPREQVSYPGGPVEAEVEGKVALEPNHSHFVLVEGKDWGDEVETMYGLAEELSRSVPVLTLLINGGPVAKQELLESVRRGWPIIVIEGSGRLADEVARLWREKSEPEESAQLAEIKDPQLVQIIAEGRIHLYSSNAAASDLQRLMLQLGGDHTLRTAWEQFALYDYNAGLHQTGFKRLLLAILMLGVAGTVLALTQKQLVLWTGGTGRWGSLAASLRPFIVLIPITTSVLLAANNRFQARKKWILLRGGAEALKREIYRYRTRTGSYNNQQTAASSVSREVTLARQVVAINRSLSRTEVKSSALRPYQGTIPPEMFGATKSDDGFSQLTPERYLLIRLGDQINYYETKTNTLERRLKRLQWTIYITGGVGTFLAAMGAELWIALTTALATALAAYLSQNQIEDTLMSYNQALSDLHNVRSWWTSLTDAERRDQSNIDNLVEQTEKILEGESVGWVQKMQNPLAEERKTDGG
jgi:hypothetical protein